VNGKDAKLVDLKEGQHVKVTPSTGTAKKIVATTEKKGDKKNATKKNATTKETTKKDATTKETAAKDKAAK
jgi:predicted DNA-binding antitoxin AbrB/MazE fold protein